MSDQEYFSYLEPEHDHPLLRGICYGLAISLFAWVVIYGFVMMMIHTLL